MNVSIHESAEGSVGRSGGQILQVSLQKPKHTAKSLEDLVFTCPSRIEGKPCWIVGQEKKGCREGGSESEMLSGSRKRKVPSSSSCASTNDSTTSTTTGEYLKNTTTPSMTDENGLGYGSDSFKNVISTFLSSGCCILTQALPESFITSSKVKITKDLHNLQNQLQLKKQKAIASNDIHLLSQCSRGDFRELVDRDGGRRDIRFQLDRFPFTSSGLVYNSVVYPVVKELLGGSDDVTLLYAGIMWALPFADVDNNNKTLNETMSVDIDAISQKWHGDGGHLFDHVHLPPHCINVFYPLVDIHTQNGPTDVKVGTHRLGHFNDDDHHVSSSNDMTNDGTQLSLTCNVGDAILFDYRLKHRGGVNLTLEPRPVLYLAYAKPFFRDVGNTRSGHGLFDDHESTTTSSPPWVSRILNGDAVLYGHGFDDTEPLPTSTGSDVLPCDGKSARKKTTLSETTHQNGSGERWILFKMNVELPDCDEPKILTVYHGDVAIEVSTQFCKSNGLGDDFIPVLANTIQSQIDSVKD